MKRVVTVQKAVEESKKLRESGKKVVLAGGCFDILHKGHLNFLRGAKRLGDFLFILLESDETVKKLKGKKRPINNFEERARILSNLKSVDFVIKMEKLEKNEEYDKLVTLIFPAVIAATYGDLKKDLKEKQARKVGAKVVYLKKTLDESTTNYAEILSNKKI